MVQKINKNNDNRIVWLDILRGIAALLVVLSHLSEKILKFFPESSILYDLFKCLFVIPNLGKVGVVVFFILSGFVIPYSLKKKSIKQFIISRFFRLYPIYWFSILMYCLLTKTSLLDKHVLINLTMFQKFVGVEDLIGAFWTLQIELIFYFLCAIYKIKGWLFNLRAINITKYSFLVIGFLMSFFRFFWDKKLPIGLCLALYLMFIGLSLKLMATEEKKVNVKKELWIFYLIFIPICFLAYNRDYGFGETWYGYFIGYSLGIILFILGMYFRPSNKVFSFFGRISYSMYLLHPLVIYCFDHLFHMKNYILLSICFWGLIILTSTIGFYSIEKPFAKFGKKMEIKF